MVETPVFDTADKRLQPEYATGFLVDSRESNDVHWLAGHFTAFKNQNASTSKGNFSGYGVSTETGSIDFIGANLLKSARWEAPFTLHN